MPSEPHSYEEEWRYYENQLRLAKEAKTHTQTAFRALEPLRRIEHELDDIFLGVDISDWEEAQQAMYVIQENLGNFMREVRAELDYSKQKHREGLPYHE